MVIDVESLEATPKKVELSMSSYRGMPPAHSLEKYAPYAGDQGQFGTCVAFACAYSAATIAYAQTHNITDRAKITKLVYSPTYLFHSIEPTKSDCNGANPISAVLFLTKQGAPFMRTVPYACGRFWNETAEKEARSYRLSDAHLFTVGLIPRQLAAAL